MQEFVFRGTRNAGERARARRRAGTALQAWQKLVAGLAASAFLVIGPSIHAQGVTDTEIILGQTTGFTGPVADSAEESTAGARLYFDWVNSQGGVNGRKINLVSLDDKFNPKQAAENAKKLIDEKHPIAFFITRGTPHTEAIMPALKEAGIPMIAPGTGAELFHHPVNPLVFNVRATYRIEIAKGIEHMVSTGLNRIALVYVNDSFGTDGLAGFNTKMEAIKLKPVMVTSFDRVSGDINGAAQEVAKVNPQVVFGVGSSVHISKLINKVRELGNNTQFVTLSNNSAKGFIKALGKNARGVVVVQAFPNPNGSAPIAREMKNLAKGKAGFVMSQQAVEGFAVAKMTTEALRRAGKKPTSKSLMEALEGLKNYDLGGIDITYGPDDHTGGELAEMSIIDARGEYLQ